MKSITKKALAGSAFCLVSSYALASGDTGSALGLAKISAGLAIGIGAAGAATAQGKAASAALEGIGRNPVARGEVFVPMILSLAFMEVQALLAFVVAWRLLG